MQNSWSQFFNKYDIRNGYGRGEVDKGASQINTVTFLYIYEFYLIKKNSLKGISLPKKLQKLKKFSLWTLNETGENRKIWKKIKDDDIILFFNSPEINMPSKFKKIFKIFHKISNFYGLKINLKKTKYLK